MCENISNIFYVFQHSANPQFCDTVNCSEWAPIRSCFMRLFSAKGITLTNKDRRMPSPNYKKPEDDKGQVWSPLMAPLVTLVAPWCTPWWPLVNPCSLRTMPRKPFHDGPSFATQLPPLLCWSWLWRWLCKRLKLFKSKILSMSAMKTYLPTCKNLRCLGFNLGRLELSVYTKRKLSFNLGTREMRLQALWLNFGCSEKSEVLLQAYIIFTQ